MMRWFMARNSMTGGVRMRLNNWIIILILLEATYMYPQSPVPASLVPQEATGNRDTLQSYSGRMEKVVLLHSQLPSSFQNAGINEVTDSTGVLNPFWEKLRLLRIGFSTDTIRVVHIGDSHIRGHLLPQTTGDRLTETFGAISYIDMGINGAFCTTFTTPARIAEIAALNPDLLILSFGTNESHNRKYTAMLHKQQMEELVRMLRASLPGIPLLMTTPPGSFEKLRIRRRWNYKINPRTAVVSESIRRFSEESGLAVWDMYEAVGGSRNACLNWQNAGLMRPDHVHYLPEGYELQGELFFQALLKAYNKYVEY